MEVEQLKQFKINNIYFSEIGSRVKNEDKVFSRKIKDNAYLFMIADGIGGHENGDIAAEIAIDTITEKITSNVNSDFFHLINNAFLESHIKINTHYNNAGTTIGGCLLDASSIKIFWAGDVKIYILGNEFYTNKEHTVLNLLRDSNQIIKPEEINRLKNTVTRAIGGKSNMYSPELINIEANNPLKGLICSDGVHQFFSDSEMFELLKSSDPEELIESLKMRARTESKDNYSAILFYSE